MAEINDLNVTDASNTARFPENMAPSAVNDGARALEGILARWHKDNNGSLVSTGSANAYVLAANQTISAYYDGLSFTFETNFANTAAATLNVDAVGAQSIVWPDGAALASGDIPSGAKITVRYDNDNTRWLLTSMTKRTLSVLGPEQASTSDTKVDFTGIPTWAKRITISFVQVSTDGTSNLIVQIGDSGGFETSGYTGSVMNFGSASGTSALQTGGFGLTNVTTAASVWNGSYELNMEDLNFTWVGRGIISRSDAGAVNIGSGAKQLTAALDRVRITTSGGTDNFDNGAINILYE